MLFKRPNKRHLFETKREAKTATNKRVLDLLSEKGADFEKQQDIDFYFLGKHEKLLLLRESLLAQGFTNGGGDLPNGFLVMQKKFPLHQLEDLLIVNSLEILSKELGVDFDGWGTGIET
jgi:hypothetical protein